MKKAFVFENESRINDAAFSLVASWISDGIAAAEINYEMS